MYYDYENMINKTTIEIICKGIMQAVFIMLNKGKKKKKKLRLAKYKKKLDIESKSAKEY